MTMRLDIVTNDAGELVRREHARDLGAQVVIAIYRLAKLAQMHDVQNQAFTRQLEQTHEQIVEYGLRAGTHVNILFAQRAVFVAGQLLKGSRSTYEMATELGDILEWCGGQELTVQRDITPQEIHAFAEAVSVAMRLEKGKGFRSPSPKIRLRPVTDAARLRGLEIEKLTQEQRIVRNYASAVVIMRRFFEDLHKSHYILPRRIKRIAQNLVDLSEGATPAFLGVTEVRNQNHDDAGRAVNTAILAVTIARELTSDRVALAQIAMAAMMHDVGRPRAAALGGGGGPHMTGIAAKLSEEAEDKLATGTAAVLTALGRLNEPTIIRTVVAFEALWMRRQKWIGAVYRGARPPTLQSRILAIARRYNDLLTPDPGLPPPLPDFAVATLADDLKEPADRTVLRMLVAALGLFPIGTVAQLTSGEVGEVIAASDRHAPLTHSDRPRLRLVMDAQGAVYERSVEVDLAVDPGRRITKVISIEGWNKGLAALTRTDGPKRPSSSPVARSNPAPGSGVVDVGRGSAPPVEPLRVPADRVPTARGTLAATPVVHTLVYMFDHALSGTVLLREADGGQHAILFQEGAPAKARTRRSVGRSGNVLLAKIAAVVNLPPETDYAFYQDYELVEAWEGDPPAPCEPLNAILAAVRAWHDRARIRVTLGRIAKQPLSFHPQADVTSLFVTPEESAVVDAIRSSRSTITTLYQEEVADEESISSVVYTLAVTRCFAFTAPKGLPMGVRAVPSASDHSAPAAPAGENSTRVVIAMPPAGFPAPSVSGPPQPLSSPSPSPSSPRSKPVPRIAPVATWRPPPQVSEHDESERVLQAMTDFRLAETALARNDLRTAERHAIKATVGEPANGDYIALVAWLSALSGKADVVNEAIGKLSDVLKRDPFCERALLYRGKLLKRMNRHSEALRDFQSVLDASPTNSEAASEARFLRMQKKRR